MEKLTKKDVWSFFDRLLDYSTLSSIQQLRLIEMYKLRLGRMMNSEAKECFNANARAFFRHVLPWKRE